MIDGQGARIQGFGDSTPGYGIRDRDSRKLLRRNGMRD